MNLQRTTPIFFLFLLFSSLFTGVGCNRDYIVKNVKNVELGCSDCNVILICIDSLRADHLGVYGYYRNTSPNIDALAQQSLVFDQVITQASWTLPSLLATMTSLYPSTVIHYAREIPEDETNAGKFFMKAYPNLTNLAAILKANGYATGAVVQGGFMDPYFGWGNGFDMYEVRGPSSRLPRSKVSAQINRQALKWLDQNQAKPFFLFLYYMDVHAPYKNKVPAEYDVFASDESDAGDFAKQYGAVVAPLLSQLREDQKLQISQAIAGYDANILHVDYHLGQLFTQLSRLGLDTNTLIVLFADHGEELGDHTASKYHRAAQRESVFLGHTFSPFNEVLRVPLIIRHPQLGQQRIPYRAQLIDLAPTILDILGIQIPTQFEGKSLTSFLNGTEQVDRDAFIIGIRSKRQPYKMFVAISGESKYVLLPTWGRDANQSFLYNLRIDPKETTELAAQHPDTTDVMHTLLMDWRKTSKKKSEALPHHVGALLQQPIEEHQRIRENLRSLGYVD